MIKRANLRKIESLSVLALKNALRLHDDSVLLYKNKRYSSSYFLSIIAMEEIGKYFILERLIFHSRVEGRYTLQQEREILSLICIHRVKQSEFVWNMDSYQRFPSVSGLDVKKQNALYVGLHKRNIAGKINNPAALSASIVKKQIRYLNDCLIEASMRCSIQGDIDAGGGVLNFALAKKLVKKWPYISEKSQKAIRAWGLKYKRYRLLQS